MFGVQLYKNNARALLSRILSILNLDWLQLARSVRGGNELLLNESHANYVTESMRYAVYHEHIFLVIPKMLHSNVPLDQEIL